MCFRVATCCKLFKIAELTAKKRFATEESMKEIHRVLRPGAVFGMIWNIEDCMGFLLIP